MKMRTDRFIMIALVAAMTIFTLSNAIYSAIKGYVTWTIFYSIFLACDLVLLVWQLYLLKTSRKRDEKYVKQFVKKNIYDEVMNSAARKSIDDDKSKSSKDSE